MPTKRPEPRKILYLDVSIKVSVPMSLPAEEHYAILSDIEGAMKRHLEVFLANYPKKRKDIKLDLS